MRRKSFVSGIRSSEITPEEMYISRRKFIRMAALAGASALISACGVDQESTSSPISNQEAAAPGISDELGDPATPNQDITNYNNFYEFSLEKEGIGRLAEKFVTDPWSVEIGACP